MSERAVAIVGYACRVPGGISTIDDFWNAIETGRDVIARSSNNVGATHQVRVNAYGRLQRTEEFAREYFGYSSKEAAQIDPQQRLLLECAVEALEHGGLGRSRRDLEIGAFMAVGTNASVPQGTDGAVLSASIGADPQYAATRVAFKLGLEGAAFSVGSACSSSLVAVHLAVQSIVSGECDAALAGGVDLEQPQPGSYLAQPGGILSKSGTVRPFDADADGTVFASGGGVVALVDLELAESRGLPVLSIIRGSAINNDGQDKASFTAPRTDRQASVIATAMAVAGARAEQIAYHEAHGTATLIGDSSELSAIEHAYGLAARNTSIALGALKANIGHTRVGSGVLGLIKVSEVLRRRTIPPIANLAKRSKALSSSGLISPRSADEVEVADGSLWGGVSSFGFGGTNAHVVLESVAPADIVPPSRSGNSPLLAISAEDPELAHEYLDRIRVASKSVSDPTRLAATLERAHEPRAYRVSARLASPNQAEVVREGWSMPGRPWVLVLPGQGSNLAAAARELRLARPRFAAHLDQVWADASGVVPNLGPLDHLLEMERPLLPMATRHLLDLAFSLALVDDLAERGALPTKVFGLSMGEFAAAYAAGALARQDAIRLVSLRATVLAESSIAGGLVATRASADDVRVLDPSSHPAIKYANGTAAYASEAPELLVENLAQAGHRAQLLDVDAPYHSPMLSSLAARFRERTSPIVHVESDRFMSLLPNAAQPTDAGHWATHLESTVDLALLREVAGEFLVVDATPGGVATRGIGGEILHLFAQDSAAEAYEQGLAAMWVSGIEVAMNDGPACQMISLPPRPFATEQIAVEKSPTEAPVLSRIRREADLSRWTYQPSWTRKRRGVTRGTPELPGENWIVFASEGAISESVIQLAHRQGLGLFIIAPIGCSVRADAYVLPGDQVQITEAVVRAVTELRYVDRVIHTWCSPVLGEPTDLNDELMQIDSELEQGFYSILWATQAAAKQQGARPLRLETISRGAHPFDEQSTASAPSRALLNGPTLVIPQDFPFVSTRSIDVSELDDGQAAREVVEELGLLAPDKIVTFGAGRRWVRGFERDLLPEVTPGQASRLRQGGVYLITGGLGGIGMTIADFLVRHYKARLILTSLDSAPSESEVSSGVPDQSRSNPELVARRIAQIRLLEDLGGEVLARESDAASAEATQALLAEIDARFGVLNGVIHAAGVFETQNAFRALDDTGRSDCDRRLQPKVHATAILCHLLRGRELDFMLMQSSLSSHLGGLGFYAYTAGNSFMDAFAERYRSSRLPAMSVNWDGWIFHERDTDDRTSVISPSFASPDFGVVAEIAIRPSEGAAIYEQLMNLDDPHQVLVSTADFERRIEQWVTGAAAPVASPTEDTAPGSDAGDTSLTELESRVAQIWRNELGATGLQRESNFFALGGDSLIGVSLAYELSREFGAVISVISLFENPTLGAMADILEAQRSSSPASI